ncbi:histidine kinase-like ATPase [Sporodiniella umbellata]|nr:histidine kinase-like ATPase [Sporodiniella umbellata]
MDKNSALQDAENKIRFLADMSHEIRTPLNAVIALTDLLLQERNALNDEQTEHLQVIQTSGNHLLTVINDILDISKINHNPGFKLEYRAFSLRKCIKDTLNMARHQAANTHTPKIVRIVECPPDINDSVPILQLVKQLKSINLLPYDDDTIPFIWKIDPEIPDRFTGDTVRLTQILVNLCSNATKFTKSGGIQIRISKPITDFSNFKERYAAQNKRVRQKNIVRKHKVRQEADSSDSSDSCYYDEAEDSDPENRVTLEISVIDTGIGMPANRLPRLFKSFSQIDISTTRKYGGTGLGLAISSMLVSRMGGELWVESEEGVGSRFAFTLPLTVNSQQVPSSPSSSSSLSSSGDSIPTLSSKSISIPEAKTTPMGPPTSNTGLQNMISKTHIPEAMKTVPNKVIQEENMAKKENPINILLAEDNILNQKIAVSILKRLGYQDVTTAGNGKEALDLITKHDYDIVFVRKREL